MTSEQTVSDSEKSLERIKALLERVVREDEALSNLIIGVNVWRDDSAHTQISFAAEPKPEPILSLEKTPKFLLHVYIADAALQCSDEVITRAIRDGLAEAGPLLLMTEKHDVQKKVEGSEDADGPSLNVLVGAKEHGGRLQGITTGLITIGAYKFAPWLGVKLGIDPVGLRDMLDVGIVSTGYHTSATVLNRLSTYREDKAFAEDAGEPLLREGLKSLKKYEEGRVNQSNGGWSSAAGKAVTRFFEGETPSAARRIKASKRREERENKSSEDKPRGRE